MDTKVPEPIAIIGSSSGFYHPNDEHHGASNAQHPYLLEEDPCVFDAPFFSWNAREAEAMDPQHRVLLETVYECLENAGTSIQELQNTQTGVYVGLMTNDYHDIHLRDMETIPKYSGTGTTRSILSNRVSYFFNWKGPSMTIDTAFSSSSLVAVHPGGAKPAVRRDACGDCSGRESDIRARDKRVGLAEEDSAPPLWLSNPRFSHMKWEDKKLKAATQVAQAESILCTSFATRLAAILQMSADSIAQDTPLVEVGIDSLIAVEVRSWFLKELNVDVPVLKVIGGASIRDICRDVLDKLSLTFDASESPSEAPNDKPVSVTTVDQGKSPFVDTDDVSGEFDPRSDGLSLIKDNIAPPSLQSLAVIRSAPLSHAQERIWLAHRYSDDSSAYNVAFTWKLQGHLDCDRFEAAIQAVIQRHEALHTAFRVNSTTGGPEQFTFCRE
ncbi:beta-ketoacyl synthase [Aspergillus flavus]|uniref:Beta-ketoacyl synthase n=1 Tax=Aspergillus flavus TaxID=5059 RepID=A0A5N6GMW9_ASPFL|nr:beta-ketoacyl synthase [Aspergillus flavus]